MQRHSYLRRRNISGTSAGARSGWKTRKGQLPPVSAGRQKSPIRQKAGARAAETRRLHERNRQGAVWYGNMKNQEIRRMELRGQISAAQADEALMASQREYERQLRMNPVRHRKRGKKKDAGAYPKYYPNARPGFPF